MFQFTREFIINDNEGKIGGKRFDLNQAKDTLFVDNMVNIRKKDVNAIYKHAFEAEVKESGTWTIPAPSPALVADTLYRLVITLGVQGKTTAEFNDYYPDHSRHFFYETTVPAGASAADIATGLKKAYDHEKTLWGSKKFMDLSVSGADIKIDTPDCYTRIKEVRLVTVPVSDPQNHVGAVLTGYEDYSVIFDWVRKDGTSGAKAFVEGKEGNGNTVQILKNMRLQTAANLNPYGLEMEERPLPKGKYDQYTVELVTERRHIGQDVMGSVGTSLTTLVFYVLTSDSCESQAISAAFEAALTDLWEKAPLSAKNAPAEPKRVLAHSSDLPEAEEEESSSAE